MASDVSERLKDVAPENKVLAEEKLQELNKELKRSKEYSDRERQEALGLGKKLYLAQKEIDEAKEAIKDMEKEARAKNAQLTNRVRNLVNSLDERFSRSMEAFGNAGSVELEGNSMDEDVEVARGRREKRDANSSQYRLNINVSFEGSKDAQMHRLSTGVQSGGEKSVVTALYMMALQEMTSVPFRCVDEINQGTHHC